MNKKIFIILLIAVVCIITGYFMFMHQKNKKQGPMVVNPVEGSNLMIKAKGTLALSKEGVLYLERIDGNVRYCIEGTKADEIKANIGKVISVFGKMKTANPQAVNDNPVKCNIEVEEFALGGLTVGEKLR